MSTDVNLLGKALIRLAILVFLFVISPISLTIAFKAIKLYTEGLAYWLSIIFLISAGCLLIFTIFFAFKTFSKISKAIFNK
ncbi:DUF6095 family protein [Polaribacter sp.]|nr:DUF6095 family protein [Polaribacter sp.]